MSDTVKTCHRGHKMTPNNVYKCGKYDKCKECIQLWRDNNKGKIKAYMDEYRKLPGIKKVNITIGGLTL